MPKSQWKKSIEEIHVGRAASAVPWLETVSLKLPYDVINLIDSVADNRSKFIRTAILHELDRVLSDEVETEDMVVDECENLSGKAPEETHEKEINTGDQSALF